MTHPLAGMVRDDGSVVIPASLAGEVLRRLVRDINAEVRANGGQPSPACRQLLAVLHEAANRPQQSARFVEETDPAPASTVEVTVEQAARVIGSSTQWARTLARCGRVRARRVGRTWLIDLASLDTYRHGKEARVKVQVHSPYGGNYETDVILPGTGTLRSVRFTRGVAVLDSDDPAVLVFRGMSERAHGAAYTVTPVGEPAGVTA